MALLMFAIPAVPAFCQGGGDDCIKGRFDGEKAAKGSPGWYVAGFFCGIFGFIAAAIVKPAPPADVLVGKSPEYVTCFTDAYQSKSKNRNIMNACAGWALGASVALLIMSIQQANEVSSY
jgi:hypothetical protein